MNEIREIKEIRRKLDLTQHGLARLAGVSQSLIAKIESGRIDPAYSKVQAIFQALEQERHRSHKVVGAKELMTKPLIGVNPAEKLHDVIALMKTKAISQLPVLENGQAIGSVSEERFVDWMAKYGNRLGEIRVREAMGESFPIIPSTARLEVVTSLLRHYKAVLVKEGEKLAGIITKVDLIKAME